MKQDKKFYGIHWSLAGAPTRLAIVELLGWSNRKGFATAKGKRIVSTEWGVLSAAVRNVLTTAGVAE